MCFKFVVVVVAVVGGDGSPWFSVCSLCFLRLSVFCISFDVIARFTYICCGNLLHQRIDLIRKLVSLDLFAFVV